MSQDWINRNPRDCQVVTARRLRMLRSLTRATFATPSEETTSTAKQYSQRCRVLIHWY